MTSQDDKASSGHVKASIIGGIFALLAACIGGAFLILNTMVDNGVIIFGMSKPSTQPTAETDNSALQSTAMSTTILYDGWVICWHGKFGYEYLIAYPESTVEQGLNLSILLPQPWGGGAEYLPNDSLKMCLYKGVWYGEQSTPWFPYVSYIILKNDEFLLCQDSPSCSGDTWTMTRTEKPPYMQALIKQPVGSDIQVLDYK